MAMPRSRAELLYERVAKDVADLVSAGTLAPGQRAPSVRSLSKQKRVSVSTVVKAYQALEDRGLFEARPQSGYYVRRVPRVAHEPGLTNPPRAPRPVDVHGLVSRVLEDRRGPGLLPFGSSIPHPELVPAKRLQRIIASVAHRNPSTLAAYSYPPGLAVLRRQIALRLSDWGVRATADDIIVTNGCMEAINLCLRAVAKAGDVIALESPTYFGLLQVI